MTYTKTDMLSDNIIDILKEKSNEDHPLTQQQICHYLEKKYDIKPNRKTVAERLKSIEQKSDNVCAENRQKNGKSYLTNFYYVGDITFDEYELFSDLLVFSPIVPENFAKDIIVRLNKTASGSSAVKEVHAEENFHYKNQDIFINLGNIKNAIKTQKQLDVTIGEYDKNGCLLKKTDKELGITVHRYILNPYGVVLSDGFYYLLANNIMDSELRHYRIDKIVKADIFSEGGRIRPVRELTNIPQDFRPVPYKNLNRYMLDGSVERVHINIKRKDISLVLDTFGNEFTCNNTYGNDELYDVTFRANIPTVIRWVMANRGSVKLTAPKKAVEALKEEISALSELYNNDRGD